MNFIYKNVNLLNIIFVFLLFFLSRIEIITSTEYPLLDGGLFYSMTVDLIENNFHIPKYTTYNNRKIPFSYPPFGLYFSSLLIKYFKFNILETFIIIPYILSLCSVITFYFLIKNITLSSMYALLSTIIFGTLPKSYYYYLTGGGITRGFGMLFGFATLTLITSRISGYYKLGLSSIFLALTILSHPDWGLFTIYSSCFFILFLEKGFYKKIQKILILLFLTILIILPWLMIIYTNHSFYAFINASHTSEFMLNLFTSINRIQFENIIPVYIIIPIIFTVILSNKHNITVFTLIWTTLVVYLSPRYRNSYLTIHISIFLGLCGVEINEILKRFYKNNIFIKTILFIMLFIFAYSTNRYLISNYLRTIPKLSKQDISFFEWVEFKVTKNSTFVFLTPYEWWHDMPTEWFPAISGKTILYNPYGLEWYSAIEYNNAITINSNLRNCNITINELLKQFRYTETPLFIYFYKNLDYQNSCYYINFKTFLDLENSKLVFENITSELWQIK